MAQNACKLEAQPGRVAVHAIELRRERGGDVGEGVAEEEEVGDPNAGLPARADAKCPSPRPGEEGLVLMVAAMSEKEGGEGPGSEGHRENWKRAALSERGQAFATKTGGETKSAMKNRAPRASIDT